MWQLHSQMRRRRPTNSKRKSQDNKENLLRRLRRLFGPMPARSNYFNRTRSRSLRRKKKQKTTSYNKTTRTQPQNVPSDSISQKPQWPVRLNLVPTMAPFFENANLLLAADCAPIALTNFHDTLMSGKRVIIGCPKFDDARAYAQKLTEILKQNNIATITVAHMEVSCCVGLKWAINKALESSGKQIPVKEYEIKIGGEIVEL